MSYNITSATTRGSVKLQSGPTPSPSPDNWRQARDNNFFDVPSATVNTNDATAIRSAYTGVYSIGLNAFNNRYFMAFNTTSVPVQANSITLYVYCLTNISSSFMVVQATAPGTGTNISGVNYKAIPGLTDFSSMNGLVTAYTSGPGSGPGPSPSPSPDPWQPSLGWNAIPLNSAAVNDWNSGNTWAIALVNYDYDYSYQNVPDGNDQKTGISAASFPPYVLVDTTLGQWVISINPGFTSKVNGVTGSNIRLVNRVSSIGLYRGSTGGVGGPSNPACSGTVGFGTPTAIYAQYGLATPIGGIVYTDPASTVPFNGSALYWPVNSSAAPLSWGGDQWQISATGSIMDNTQSCLF